MSYESSSERIDLKLVYPFMQATIDTLRLQYSFIARPGKPVLKSQANEIPSEIISVAGLTGGELFGTIVLCFSRKVFVQIMECMHDEKYTSAGEEVIAELMEGASEMMSIILWQARKLLAEKGIDIDRSVPMTIRGDTLALSYRSQQPTVVLPFSTNVGPFHVEVTTERSSEEAEEEEDD